MEISLILAALLAISELLPESKKVKANSIIRAISGIASYFLGRKKR